MRHLYDEQQKAMMMDKDKSEKNVLALATWSGNKGIIDSVLTAAKNLLSSCEVRYLLCLTKMTDIRWRL